MGDSNINRSMDESLINTTVLMDDHRRFGLPSSPASSAGYSNWTNASQGFKSGDKITEERAAIRRFDDDGGASWRGYTSDEEVASPVENDDFAFDSTSSDSESIASIHEAQYHAQTCNNAQQLCNRAQAVQLVSVGRPKVVSMPKPVDIDASDYEIDVRPSRSSISRMGGAVGHPHIHSNITSTPRSSDENSYLSFHLPVISQPTGPKHVRRKSHLPRLQTAIHSDSSESDGFTPSNAWPVGRPNFLNYDPFGSDYPANVAASPSTPRRRLHRLSPPFSFRSLGRRLTRSSSSDGSSGERGISKRDISRPIASPNTCDVYVPTRPFSKATPKMVARGANERAAPIEIPPCPEDYQDEFEVPVRPQRAGSVANIDSLRPVAPSPRDRRKSLSALVWSPA